MSYKRNAFHFLMIFVGVGLILFLLSFVVGHGLYDLPGNKKKASNAASSYMLERYGVEISVISVDHVSSVDQGLAFNQYVVDASPTTNPGLVFEVRVDSNDFSPVEGTYGFPSSDNYVPRWFQNELETILSNRAMPLWKGRSEFKVYLFRPFQKVGEYMEPLNLSALSKSIDFEIRVETGLTPRIAVAEDEAARINELGSILDEIGLDTWCVKVFYEMDEDSIISYRINSSDELSVEAIQNELAVLLNRYV